MAGKRGKRASAAQRRARADFVKRFAGRLVGAGAKAIGRKARDTSAARKAVVARDRVFGELDRAEAKVKRLRERALDFAYRTRGTPIPAGPKAKKERSFLAEIKARERKLTKGR